MFFFRFQVYCTVKEDISTQDLWSKQYAWVLNTQMRVFSHLIFHLGGCILACSQLTAYLVYISHTCKKTTVPLLQFFCCFRRCGDIVGETFLTSVDSPNFMIVTMDTKFAGHKASHKGFKLHFEKEKEGMHKTGFAEEF